MTADPRRTYHANQAVHLSDLINLRFSTERYGTVNPRFIKVTEPDGPSTDGGRKARQAIMLCAQGDPDDRGIVSGHISIKPPHADLRSYAYVKSQYEARYKRDIDISRNEYNRLLDQLQDYLRAQGYNTSVLNTPRGGSFVQPPPAPPPKSRSVGLGVPLALVLSFGFGFLTCFLLFRYGVL